MQKGADTELGVFALVDLLPDKRVGRERWTRRYHEVHAPSYEVRAVQGQGGVHGKYGEGVVGWGGAGCECLLRLNRQRLVRQYARLHSGSLPLSGMGRAGRWVVCVPHAQHGVLPCGSRAGTCPCACFVPRRRYLSCQPPLF